MITSRFSRDNDSKDGVEAIRSHADESAKIDRVMSMTKERSKAIAKRGRDAIVAALNEGRI